MRLLHQKKWFVVILLFSYVNSFASFITASEEEGPNDPPGDSDPPVPIDNFALLLLLAAIGIGYYYLVFKKRRKTTYDS
ncbi:MULTISPECIES: hypothetical protein [unclassified Flavobacterium]|uniref:hypothetical protein n=1 Tax=unclassified Flavobacterium TaxID=196869 RepID=UPI00086A3B78|nr:MULTISPECIES: hypothetical protein [unclassified Flavobacterium]MBN9283219.1 hypothetical protein [Flavobacterium sp.]ODS81891.1 MAG: hypothetical protein ABS44_18765 [Chryseobacterium sp. SCN 40-13]OJV67842.1 MAG: hypothetical protein BGO42_17635 [Flavobacterium sp. 40-81]